MPSDIPYDFSLYFFSDDMSEVTNLEETDVIVLEKTILHNFQDYSNDLPVTCEINWVEEPGES